MASTISPLHVSLWFLERKQPFPTLYPSGATRSDLHPNCRKPSVPDLTCNAVSRWGLGEVFCYSSLSWLIHSYCVHTCSASSSQTLWDPMDCNPPGSSVHVILQAWILEWVAMPSSRGSSRPRDQTRVTYISYVSCIDSFFTTSATRDIPHAPVRDV